MQELIINNKAYNISYESISNNGVELILCHKNMKAKFLWDRNRFEEGRVLPIHVDKLQEEFKGIDNQLTCYSLKLINNIKIEKEEGMGTVIKENEYNKEVPNKTMVNGYIVKYENGEILKTNYFIEALMASMNTTSTILIDMENKVDYKPNPQLTLNMQIESEAYGPIVTSDIDMAEKIVLNNKCSFRMIIDTNAKIIDNKIKNECKDMDNKHDKTEVSCKEVDNNHNKTDEIYNDSSVVEIIEPIKDIKTATIIDDIKSADDTNHKEEVKKEKVRRTRKRGKLENKNIKGMENMLSDNK